MAKLKKLLNKIFTDKKTNDLVFTIVYLPFLVIGLAIKQPYLYLGGGFLLAIINIFIKKVVMRKNANSIKKKEDKN